MEKPRAVSCSLFWDLDVALRDLMSSKSEPLTSLDFKTLTEESLFLISLATAKRVGELQPLSNVGSS